MARQGRAYQLLVLEQLLGVREFKRTYSRLALSAGAKDPLFGLNDLERLAIWIYTTPNDLHQKVNRGLWQRSVPPEIKGFATILNKALRKLPRVEGPVYRGMLAKTDEAVLSRYRRNAVIRWRGFTSTTRDRHKAYVGNLLFRIYSRSGRSIQGYTADELEEEVLFESGTEFYVRDLVEHPDGTVVIDLIEWDLP
jgi:hypothetical protein